MWRRVLANYYDEELSRVVHVLHTTSIGMPRATHEPNSASRTDPTV